VLGAERVPEACAGKDPELTDVSPGHQAACHFGPEHDAAAVGSGGGHS
jgi:hypothetical protein